MRRSHLKTPIQKRHILEEGILRNYYKIFWFLGEAIKGRLANATMDDWGEWEILTLCKGIVVEMVGLTKKLYSKITTFEKFK